MLVQRAAGLERAGALEELALEPRAQRAAREERRALEAVADRLACAFDVGAGGRYGSATLAHRLEEQDGAAVARVQAVDRARVHRDRHLRGRRRRATRASRPASSAPTRNAVGRVEVGVGVPGRRADDRGDLLQRQRAHVVERRLENRQREDGAGRSADRVRVPGVGQRRRRRAARRRRPRPPCAPSRRGCPASRSRPRRARASAAAAARAAAPRTTASTPSGSAR